VQVRSLLEPLTQLDQHSTEGLPSARYPVSKTGGAHALGGSTPSPSAQRADPRRAARPRQAHAGTRALHQEAWPSRQGSALLARRRRESLAGSSPAASVKRSKSSWPRAAGTSIAVFRCSRAGRRATVTREAQVRVLPPEPLAPVVERAMTPDSQSGSCGFEPRRGFCHFWLWGRRAPRRLWAPEIAGSTPAGQTCAVEERLSSRAS
jgi:hypothetical protein